MPRPVFKDQMKYEKYAKDPETDSLLFVSREEADVDDKYGKCVIIDAERPVGDNPTLPTTAFLECGGKPVKRIKMRD